MKKFRILIFAPDFYPTNGGYANAITNFVKELVNDENIEKIIVFTTKSLDKEKELDIPKTVIIRKSYIKIPLTTFITPLLWIKSIEYIIKKEKITHIFYETGELPNFGILLYNISKKYNIPFMLRLHATTDTEMFAFPTNLYYKILSFFAKRFYRKVKNISATNNYHIKFFKKYFLKENPFLISQKNFFVIPNLNITNNSNNLIKKDNKVLKNLINLTDNNKVFLTLGRLNKEGFLQKGIMDLIHAVYLISDNDKNILSNVKFLIIGNGIYKNHIIKEIKRLNLEEYFMIIDYLPNECIQYLQKKVTATILLSRFEGLSMFALEALSNGSPLLLTKVGGLVDLINEGKNGFFVEPQNIDDISQKIKMFISLDLSEIEKMRIESKKIFQSKFDKTKIINKFIKILEVIS